MKRIHNLSFFAGVVTVTCISLILLLSYVVGIQGGRAKANRQDIARLEDKLAKLEFVAEDLLLYQKIEDIFIVEGKNKMSREETRDCARIVYRYHKEYAWTIGLTHARIFAVIKLESTFKPDVKSTAGALGLMQIMPSNLSRLLKECFGLDNLTSKQRKSYALNASMSLVMGLELLIQHQLDYLSANKASKDDWKLAHTRYNWMKKSVEALESGKKSTPKATLEYALEIERLMKRYEG